LKQERRGIQSFLSLQAENGSLREQRAMIDAVGQQLVQIMAVACTAAQHQDDDDDVECSSSPTAGFPHSPEVLRQLGQDVSSIQAVMQGILANSGRGAEDLKKQSSKLNKPGSGVADSASKTSAKQRGWRTASPVYVSGKVQVAQNNLIFRDDVAYVPEPAAFDEEAADTFSWSPTIENGGHSSSDPEADISPIKSTKGARLRSVSSLSTVCSMVEQASSPREQEPGLAC
jgi:hypothetical protein